MPGTLTREGRLVDATNIGGAPIDRSTKLASESREGEKDQDVRIDSIDELVEFFITAGKRGVAVNRYKGLGEMNPGPALGNHDEARVEDPAAGSS